MFRIYKYLEKFYVNFFAEAKKTARYCRAKIIPEDR